MKLTLGCNARRVNDQMMCAKCKLNWDHNDPEPPTCRPDTQLKVEHANSSRFKKSFDNFMTK